MTTPGPWIAGDDEDSDFYLVGPEIYPGIVANPVVRLHDEGNARLIAAAPELLEALQWCVSQGRISYTARLKQNSNFCDGVDKVYAVIAKATGKS